MLSRIPARLRASRQLATFVMSEAPKNIAFAAAPSAGVFETVLDNGVKVITRNDGVSRVANIAVSVAAGSRHEAFTEKGSAHVIAATAFTGTTKRSGLRLLRDLENSGVEVDAHVDRDSIVFNATVHNGASVAVAAQGIFEAVALRNTKSHTVIDKHDLLELKYSSRCNYGHVKELLHEAAYGERAPLASLYAEDASSLSDEAVHGYYQRHFHANNVVVYGSGVDHATLTGLAKEHLKALSNEKPKQRCISAYAGGEVRVRQSGATESTIGLAFPVPDGKDAKAYYVLAEVLRSQLRSHPLVRVFVTPYTAGGLWGFYVQGETEQAVAGLHKAIEGLKAAGSASVEDAKTSLNVDGSLRTHGKASVAQLQHAHSLGLSVADSNDFSGVAAADVASAVSNSLKATPAFAVLGQTFGVPKLDAIAKLLK